VVRGLLALKYGGERCRMEMTMRHAMEAQADGPLAVRLKDGSVLRAAYIDGGGFDLTTKTYEVHGLLLDGGFLRVPQERIENVTTAAGEELEFGSPYFPGHPRPQELPEGEL
jgi:hypothetical protein